MVWWVPVAMAAASIAAKLSDSNRKQHKRRRQYRAIEEAGGLAGYDPAVGKLQMAQGDPEQGGLPAYYQSLLENFQGRSQDLTDTLERNAPLLPGTLANTPGFEYAQGFQDPSRLPEANALQQYGSQAGAMGRAGAMGQRRAAAGLTSRGLGSSTAMASLASQAAQAQGANQSNLYAQLHQQAFQQRMAQAQTMSQWAQRAFDMQRDIANMSLGAIHSRRTAAQQDKSGLYGALAGAAGQAAAAYFSSGSRQSASGNPGGDTYNPDVEERM